MADAKQGKTPIEDFYSGASQSRVVLAKPRLGGFGGSSFASGSSKSCNPFGSVLRPSTLKPGSNPFLKVTEKEEEEKEDKGKKEYDAEDRLKEKEPKEEVEAPKFVPLGSANVTPRTSNPVPAPVQPAPSASSSGFVFGQNLSERVVIDKDNLNNGDAAALDHSATNGTTELLFTSAAASVKENNQEEASTSSSEAGSAVGGVGGVGVAAGGVGGAGLAAAAAEYERSHARPPPPTTSYNLTGEEDEVNVLQISCRLFAWEGGSWRERGRGVLRLNETEHGSDPSRPPAARLVVRVAGSLRVVLNTLLWPDMIIERAGTKSLRITAADAQQQIKLYLIMGAPADIVQLHRALTSRVSLSKRANCALGNSQRAAERLERIQHPDTDFTYTTHTHTRAEHTHDNQHTSDDKVQDTNSTPEAEDPKPLKRKEPVEDETASKRQCPEATE